MTKISLNIGSGGKTSFNFINNEIVAKFSNDILNELGDGANIENDLVITTDTFTVYPYFFEGGDIGKLAVCGMVNDLASMCAKPVYMTMALVIEEGFDKDDLTKIIDSIKLYSQELNIKLVSGDTKVVEKNKMEGVHINLTGVGKLALPYKLPVKKYNGGEKIILTGCVGEHSLCLLKAKDTIDFEGDMKSDVAPLWKIVEALIEAGIKPLFIRDVTRGGASTILNELAILGNCKILVNEQKIPQNDKVKSICDIYGFDIYSLACEGKMIIVVEDSQAEQTIDILKQFEESKNSAVIGEIVDVSKPIVIMQTVYGGKTVLDMPLGELLPRIC